MCKAVEYKFDKENNIVLAENKDTNLVAEVGGKITIYKNNEVIDTFIIDESLSVRDFVIAEKLFCEKYGYNPKEIGRMFKANLGQLPTTKSRRLV